jgi:hypothetical protein
VQSLNVPELRDKQARTHVAQRTRFLWQSKTRRCACAHSLQRARRATRSRRSCRRFSLHEQTPSGTHSSPPATARWKSVRALMGARSLAEGARAVRSPHDVSKLDPQLSHRGLTVPVKVRAIPWLCRAFTTRRAAGGRNGAESAHQPRAHAGRGAVERAWSPSRRPHGGADRSGEEPTHSRAAATRQTVKGETQQLFAHRRMGFIDTVAHNK